MRWDTTRGVEVIQTSEILNTETLDLTRMFSRFACFIGFLFSILYNKERESCVFFVCLSFCLYPNNLRTKHMWRCLPVVAPCSLLDTYRRFRGAYCHHQGDDHNHDAGGSKILCNASIYLPDYTARRTIRQSSSCFVLSEFNTSMVQQTWTRKVSQSAVYIHTKRVSGTLWRTCLELITADDIVKTETFLHLWEVYFPVLFSDTCRIFGPMISLRARNINTSICSNFPQ
jgi:hypothetical protein